MTRKEIARTIRALKKNEYAKFGDTTIKMMYDRTVAYLKGEDDSDPATDYNAWTYGVKQKWAVDWVCQDLGIQ